ncbi:MAG: pyridoxamine 5'-phosphate oxidase family protein [Acidimicrobiia bacterium]
MARVDITMTDDERATYLAVGETLIVSTLGPRGAPHVTPMWFFVDDEGRIVFRSFTRSQKIVNLQRNPRLTVLVESGLAYAELKGVMIEGRARLVDGADDPAFVLESYRRLAAKYPMVGPDPVDLDDDALEAAFGRFAPKNTAVVVEPRRIASWDHTKLDGRY